MGDPRNGGVRMCWKGCREPLGCGDPKEGQWDLFLGGAGIPKKGCRDAGEGKDPKKGEKGIEGCRNPQKNRGWFW